MSQLVLIRHGQSLWNKKNVFTGWVDVPLSARGIEEAVEAGKQLSGVEFDFVFTSVQLRAIETAALVLAHNESDRTPVVLHSEGKMKDWTTIYGEKMKSETLPVIRDWHLNERYYGELQGKNKAETAEEYSPELVHQWRRSYDVPPPGGECLKDTASRTIPFFRENIQSLLDEGKNILVSAHGNSLRSIVMHIEELSKDGVLKLEIATGSPLSYFYSDGRFMRS